MLEIISSSKNTQLHSFPILTTKCSYSHVANENVDFQIFPGTNVFLEINRKSGFELLRTQCKNGADTNIQRVKKRQLDDLYCAATSKIDIRDIALGLSTGFIKFFNINTGEFMPNKFAPDKIGNTVTYLDYSCCNEYLASLYENGDINLYGLKTGIKLDTLKLGNLSTLVRFNPVKKFNLAIASYSGAISVYDIQTKRKIYQDNGAHTAICKDLSMTAALPDILVSAGYDCIINVFDVRQRRIPFRIEHQHPFSTVALSHCGQYCCAGNLKGDIISYDFRNSKEPLDIKRAHSSAIIRVGFLLPYEEKLESVSIDNFTSKSSNTIEIGSATNRKLQSTEEEQQQQQQQTPTNANIQIKNNLSDNQHNNTNSSLINHRDSFNEFFDLYGNKTVGSNKQTNNRDSLMYDSFSDLLTQRKPGDLSMEFYENNHRLSVSVDGAGGSQQYRPELRLKRKTQSTSIFDRRTTNNFRNSLHTPKNINSAENDGGIDYENNEVFPLETPKAPPPPSIVFSNSKIDINSKTPITSLNPEHLSNNNNNITKRCKRKDLNQIIEETLQSNTNNTNNNENQEESLPTAINLQIQDNKMINTIQNSQQSVKNCNDSPPEQIRQINNSKDPNNNNNNNRNNNQNNNKYSVDGFVNFVQHDIDASTPIIITNSQQLTTIQQNIPVNDNNQLASSSSSTSLDDAVHKQLQKLTQQMNQLEMKQNECEIKFNDKLEVNEKNIIEKISRCENEIKFYQDTYHHQSFNNIYGLWRKQQQQLDDIKEGLYILLQHNHFVQDYLNVKAENAELKQRLKEM